MKTISIPVSKIEYFEKKLKTIQNKIAKYGKTPVSVSYGNPYIAKIDFRTHEIGDAFRNDIIETVDVEYVDVNIDGIEIIKKDDMEYRFIGNIIYDDGVKIINCFDNDYLEAFKKDVTVCDHCGTSRKRNGYSLFVDENGKVLYVGSKCVKDYMGIEIASYLDCVLKTTFIVGELEDEDIEMSRVYTIAGLYKYISKATNNFAKWVKKSEENASIEEITYMLSNPKEFRNLKNDFNEKIEAEILKYWENKEEKTSFDINSKQLIRNGYCKMAYIGTFAYAIFDAVKNIYAEKVKDVNKSMSADCPFAIGEKQIIEGTVTFRNCYSNYYGYYREVLTYSVEIISNDGVYYTMSTTTKGIEKVNVGDKITVKGTIGERKDYRDKKRWQIKCPKLVC